MPHAQEKTPGHICPWWLAYTFDNPLRRVFHKPEKIFAPYLKAGMTAVDIGCGMGYFSIGMAHLVGDKGKVIAVDLQQQMLDVLVERAGKAGVAQRIQTILCSNDDLKVTDMVDFVLAFWMVHETPDRKSFFRQVYDILTPGGKLIVAEPKLHVSKKDFSKTKSSAEKSGFSQGAAVSISLSHAAVFEKTHTGLPGS